MEIEKEKKDKNKFGMKERGKQEYGCLLLDQNTFFILKEGIHPKFFSKWPKM